MMNEKTYDYAGTRRRIRGLCTALLNLEEELNFVAPNLPLGQVLDALRALAEGHLAPAFHPGTLISHAEYREACNEYKGWCPTCKAFTRECETEPDAEGYACPECDGHQCVGAEQALVIGFINVVLLLICLTLGGCADLTYPTTPVTCETAAAAPPANACAIETNFANGNPGTVEDRVYDDQGRILTRTLDYTGDGVWDQRTTSAYDDQGRLDAEHIENNGDASQNQTRTYFYDCGE